MTADDEPPNGPQRLQKCLAWMVHLLTASGAVCCLLSVEAILMESWKTALAWLFLAVAIDAVDGTLARMVQVRKVLPQFDGTLLDNVIDYLSYVFIPALFIHRAGLVPAGISLSLAAAVCLASAYQFCQDDAKTADHFFKGFPSYWNIVALYLLAMDLSPQVNAIIIVVLVALVFVPVKYIYITRTQAYRTITWSLTIVWSLMAGVILWQLPDPSPFVVWSSLAYLVYYVGMSLYLMTRHDGTPGSASPAEAS